MERKSKEKFSDLVQSVIVGGLIFAILPILKVSKDDQSVSLLLIPLVEAGVVVIGFILAYISSTIKKWKALRKGLPASSGKLVRPQDFALPSGKAVLLGTLVFVGVLEFTNFNMDLVVGLIAGDLTLDEAFLALTPVSFITACILSFFLGRWIGKRVYDMGFAAMVAVMLFERLVVTLIDVALFPAVTGEQISLAILYDLLFLGVTAILVIFGAFGFWRGQKARPAAHLWRLVDALPEDTQKTVVKMVYEEVQSKSARPPASQSGPALVS